MTETKQVTCVDCGTPISVSKFVSAKTARCAICKAQNKLVNKGKKKRAVQDGRVQEMVGNIGGKPIKVLLQKNRSDIETHVVLDTGEKIEVVPNEWVKFKNALDYLSVSKITAYQQCPGKFYNLYWNNDHPEKDTGNIFTWFGSILHEVAEIMEKVYKDNGIVLDPIQLYNDAWKKRQLTDLSMYKQGRELIVDYFTRNPVTEKRDKCIATEFEFRVQFGGCEFGGQIDYIGEIDSETAIMKDYKTNRHPYTAIELEESLQLLVYEAVARKLFPQYKKWITGYEMFFFGWQQCPTRTPEELAAIEDYVANIWQQISTDNVWEEKLNVFCGYCSRRHECKEYCDFIKDPQRLIDTIKTDTTDVIQVDKDREMFSVIEKIAKGRKDELSAIVKNEISNLACNNKKLVIDGNEYYLQSQSRPAYDYHSANQIAMVNGKKAVLDECLSISKTKLDAALKADPELRLQMQQALRANYTEPYIAKRKYKEV